MRTVKKALLVVGVIVLAVVGVVVYYVAHPNLPHYQAPSEVRYLPSNGRTRPASASTTRPRAPW
ncbi:hypothetical protein P4233_22715 [Pseudomonas aeruginosa]|nr:hypothetical protein [Pseudomonas aeruginosa]